MIWLPVLPFLLGLLALWRRFRAVGWFLVIRAGTGLLQSALEPLWRDAPRPFQGRARVLWLLTNVAPFLAPPASLLAILGHRRDAGTIWVLSVGYVALQYPELHGDGLLLRYYPAIYLTSYIYTWFAVLWRMIQRDRFVRDEIALMLITAMGALSVVSVLRNGADAWWSTWITNGAGYLGVLVLVLAPPRT